VIAVEELEALRAHGGGVRNAELQIKLEGKIDQVKSLQDKMARMEATYAEQLAAKSAELQQQLNDAATLRTDFDAIQVRAACRHTARPTLSAAYGACGERTSSEPHSSAPPHEVMSRQLGQTEHTAPTGWRDECVRVLRVRCAPALTQDNLNQRHPEMDALEEKLADAEVRGRWLHERETERAAIRGRACRTDAFAKGLGSGEISANADLRACTRRHGWCVGPTAVCGATLTGWWGLGAAGRR